MQNRTEETRGPIRWPIVGGGFGLAIVFTVGTLAFGNRSTSSAPPPLTGDPADIADSLIALWIDSVGGMSNYEKFQSATFTVSTVLYDTLSGRVKRERPRYVWVKKGPYGEETRVERWEDAGFIEQGFNGNTTWARLNGEILPDTAKDAREALYVARDLFYWVGLPFKLRDPGVYLNYNGLVSRPGAKMRVDPNTALVPAEENAYHAVGVSFGEGVGEHQDVFTYYFRPGSGHPTEVTYVEEGRTSVNRMLWGTTERVGPTSYPYVVRRDFITSSGKRTKALVMSDFVVNPEIPQSRFEMPTTTN